MSLSMALATRLALDRWSPTMIPTTYLIRATGNHDPIHVDLSIEQAAALLDLDAKWLAKQIRKDGRHVMSDEIGGLIVEREG